MRRDTGVPAKAGDIITVDLDTDARTVTFRKNGDGDQEEQQITTVKDIVRGDYRIAVTTSMRDDAVTFV